MVSASNLQAKYVAVASKIAAWISSKLSIATLLGLAVIPFLQWLPPFLAPRSSAAPVEIVRTVPVPYLDTERPEAPASTLRHSMEDAPAEIVEVAARGSRARRQDQRESESGALGKAGTDESESGALGKAGTGESETKATAATPADPKSATQSVAEKAEAPEPDVWSDTQIIAALRDCLRRLAPLDAEIEIAQPIKQDRCGAAAPIVLRRLGAGANRVELQPPPTLNCAMVASLHTWVEKTLQPLAQELLGSPVVRIRNASGYVCRNRVGTKSHADRLSEHALANAIDISGFVTADGRTVDVLRQWGPTVRDLREQQERAWTAAQEAKTAAKQAAGEAAQAARAVRKAQPGAKRDQAEAEAKRKKEEAERKKEEARQKEAEWRETLTRTAEVQKLGRGAGGQTPRLQRGSKKASDDARGLTPIPTSMEDDRKTTEAVFLRRLHEGACGTFGTVLGPEANEAHRNHFHFDLAARKRKAFCE